MVDVGFELTTNDPWSVDDAICEGIISPLSYWQKVNQSPTQTKPYNTLPPFEPRDSWSSYGAVRAYSEVLYILWGPRESDLSGSWHEEIHFSLKSVFMVDVRFGLTTNDPWSVDDAICEGISPLGYW